MNSRIGLLLAATASILSISAVSQGSLHKSRDGVHRPVTSNADLPSASLPSPIAATVAEPMQVAGLPYGPRPPYWHHGCPAPPVPTLKNMQNYMWQSHQWRADYPVCQPLYVPTYGHFGTRWRLFPGTDCYGIGPAPPGQPF
jgi:hypothetical protein